MTLDEFRKLTADLPGETKLYYHAYDKGCCLASYEKEDMWFYPKGEKTVGIVINPGPAYDERRPLPQKKHEKEIETKKEDST
jgi:hypothetical protein